MSFTLAQQSALYESDNDGATSVLSFPTNPTTGYSIEVSITGTHGFTSYDVTSVTDSLGNTYARTVASGLDEANGRARALKYTAHNVTGGALAITVTHLRSTENAVRIQAIEFFSTLGVISTDQVGSDTEPFEDTAMTVTAAGANTNAVAFVTATAGCGSNASVSSGLAGPSSGYTGLATDTDADYKIQFTSGYKIVASGETSEASFSATFGNFDALVGCLATYRETSSGAAITNVSAVTAGQSFTITGTGFHASSNVVRLKKASQGINFTCTVTVHGTTSLTVTCPDVPDIGSIGAGYSVTVTPSAGTESAASTSFSIAYPSSGKATTLTSLADSSSRMTASADAAIGDQFLVYGAVGVADASNVTLRDDGSIKVPEALTSISARLYSADGWGSVGTQTFQSAGPSFIGPVLNTLELTFQQSVAITPIDFSTRFEGATSSVADASFIGVGTVAAGATGLAVTAPTRAVSDVLLLHVICRDSLCTQTTPTGWTIAPVSWSNGGNRVYLRVATNTSGDNATAVWDGSEHAIAWIEAYRNLDTDLSAVVLNSAAQSNDSNANVPYPALSVTSSKAVVVVAARKRNLWTSAAPISSFTETVDYPYTSPTLAHVSAQGQRWIQTTATSIDAGSIVVTGGSATYSAVVMLVLKPATTTTAMTYTASPSVPAGTALNSSTGVFDGTPTTPGTIPNFKIIATDASAQTAESNAVDLTVQSGVVEVTIPDVVGLTLGAAFDAIANAGEIDGSQALTADPITLTYDSAAAGIVLSQFPAALTVVTVLTDVALIVSRGASPLTLGTIIPTTSGYEVPVNLFTTQTAYAVAVNRNLPIPSTAQIVAGLASDGTTALAAASGSIPASVETSLTLTGLDSPDLPKHDIYVTATTASGYTETESATNEEKLPPTGKQYVDVVP